MDALRALKFGSCVFRSWRNRRCWFHNAEEGLINESVLARIPGALAFWFAAVSVGGLEAVSSMLCAIFNPVPLPPRTARAGSEQRKQTEFWIGFAMHLSFPSQAAHL